VVLVERPRLRRLVDSWVVGMSDLLEAALRYAARSWPVFHCAVREKVPHGKLAPHGFYDATTDPEVIRKWWTTEPEANIGLPTGLAFDVLDVDGEAGWSTLAHAVSKFGCLSSSPVAMTGGGGAHDLFLPTGCKNRAGFLPNLDWRGAGGYIIAPPSVHPNGKRHEWALSPDEVPLEAAPPWLVDLANRRAGPEETFLPAGSPRLAPGNTTAYAQRALEAECGRVALALEGSRNDQLNRSAHALGQLVGAHALTAEEAGNALLTAAVRTGLGEPEATATIRSGMTAGIRNPRKVAS
jgi:hypothetical protein